MRAGRLILATAATLLVAAPSAHAEFHFMKVSEVFPGTAANVNTAFIELQMFAAGQNVTGGHEVDYYTANGTLLGSTNLTNVPNGENQRKILIGDTAVQGATPDILSEQLGDALHPGTLQGGAVCFPDAQPADCVTWGDFQPQAGFPNPQAANAPLLQDGESLTRLTTPGCPNLLEPGDDTDNSAVDFRATSPTPENNSSPLAQECGGGDDTDPPNTKITKAPKGTIEKNRAKIKFEADEKSTFECKLDKGKFKSCESPLKYKKLDDGKHKVLIEATDEAGNVEEKPAKVKFKVDT